jgi:uncharacterized damage-inducible protein DinB
MSSTTGMAADLERLRYPIGRFAPRRSLGIEERRVLIEDIGAVPAAYRAAVSDLSAEQLDTPYRSGGWTVRQLVHHVPDSHLNSYIRCKLAVTEQEPTIKPYDEAAWSELGDARGADIEMSLALLEALHLRWTTFLRSLAAEQFACTFRHPELGLVTLDTALQLYAWHGRHHLAHIESLRARMGW